MDTNQMRKVVDICSCGHLGGGISGIFEVQQHGARLDISAGHGKCQVKDCLCERFTWVGFATESQIEKVETR